MCHFVLSRKESRPLVEPIMSFVHLKGVPVNLIKMFLSMAIAAAVCNSETVAINISGAIVDSSGKGVAGAEIRLEKGKISTKSDENGVFTLMGTVGIKPPRKNSSTNMGCEPFIIQNSKLIFTLTAQSAIEVTVYGIQGQVLSRIKQSMNAGLHALTLPEVGNGLYLCRVKIGNAEYVLKGTRMGRSSGGALKLATGKSQETLAKQAAKTATINDILSVTKDGFLDYLTPVSEPIMEMPPIKMIANAGNVIDIDGNVYQSVRIGNQVWMTENLRVTRYNDGAGITKITDSVVWANIYNYTLITPAYCYYNNMTNADSIKKWGALYTWYVVNTGKLAPAGWHVPTDSEWEVMQRYLVMHGYNYDGTTDTIYNKIAMALAAKTDWSSYTVIGSPCNNLTKNNSSGFSALPGGFRSYYGMFDFQSSYGFWWSATEADASHACNRYLYDINDNLWMDNYPKSCGFSVRLVRDN